MDIFKLPYMQQFLADREGAVKFANLLIGRCGETDSEAAFRLVERMASRYESLCHAFHTTRDESVMNLRDRVYIFFDTVHDHLYQQQEYMLPAALIAANVLRRFRYESNSDLRSYMRRVDGANDSSEAQEWLETRLDLTFCEGCDEWEYGSYMASTYGDDQRCRSCIDNNYSYSDYYDQYVYTDSSRQAIDSNGSRVLVDEDDDDFIWDEDRAEYVHCDYEPPRPQIIGNYHSSKPRHIPVKDEWSVNHHRWFGVELEVEVVEGSRQAKAEQLNDLINQGQIGSRVFFENDGSLNEGFEIISQPMSLPAHSELWRWLQDKSAISSLRSHNTKTCGLHVHVNRDGLSGIQIARMVTFINDPTNEQLIRAIARRYSEGYCRIKEKKLDTALENPDRYEALNITPNRTVEFRIFKGSLKYESVMAAVEFANSLIMFCNKFTKAEELSTPNFMSFIHDVPDHTQILRPYIAQRLELN